MNSIFPLDIIVELHKPMAVRILKCRRNINFFIRRFWDLLSIYTVPTICYVHFGVGLRAILV
jgi:hypothetical protein